MGMNGEKTPERTGDWERGMSRAIYGKMRSLSGHKRRKIAAVQDCFSCSRCQFIEHEENLSLLTLEKEDVPLKLSADIVLKDFLFG